MLYDGGEHAKQVPALLGTTENELGLRRWLEDQGHTLVTTSDKEGAGSRFDQELADAEIIITTPYAPAPNFHPGYLTAERLGRAAKLKLAVTAGIDSDCKELLYYDYQPLSPDKERKIGCRRVGKLEDMLAQCDVVTINCPLHDKTKGLFNKDLIAKIEEGLLPRQHGPRRHRRQGGRRRSPQERPPRRLRR